MEKSCLSDFLECEVYPRLWSQLDVAFPEFGFRLSQDHRYWKATNEGHTRTLPGVPRPDRVNAYENAPYGFKIHGGDFITWLAYLNNPNAPCVPHGRDFVETVRKIASLAGLSLPNQESNNFGKEVEERERVQAIREAFWSYAQEMLRNEKGKEAFEYAKKRGFSQEYIENAWKLGFYPKIEEVEAFLVSKGFSKEEIGYRSHEVKEGKPIGSGLLYDSRWEGRLIGVWRDRYGRIQNFWARDIKGQAEQNEKYLMLKGGCKDYPFGLDTARGNDIVVVESFMDVLVAQMNDGMNIVASAGRQLTSVQLENLMKCGFHSYTLAFNSDVPGQDGTEKTLSLLYENGLNAFVAIYPERDGECIRYKDAAELIVEKGIDAFHLMVEKAEKGVKWLSKHLSLKNSTDKEKEDAIEKAISYSLLMEDEKDEFVRLFAKAIGVSKKSVETRVKKRGKQIPKTHAKPCTKNTSNLYEKEELPTLQLRVDLETKTRDIVAWLDANNKPPSIFIQGRELVRVVRIPEKNSDAKKAMIEKMEARDLRAFLSERLRFVKVVQGKDGSIQEQVTDIPISVAENLLARSSWPFPSLEEVIRNPTLGKDGRLILSDGYRDDMQAWVDLGGLKVDVPLNPTKEDVEKAKHLIMEELLDDFSFVDEASKTHTIALGLLPFVRYMIDGCTPMHLVSAPLRGSGKSLLVEMLCLIATGAEPDSLTEGRDDDEWRKRITAVLLKSPAIIRLDNLTSKLDSGSLSSLLTSRVWSDRILGSSQTVSIRNNAVWTVTANNPQLSDEITRRCVWIHLDPKMDCPEERTGFKHDPLLAWVRQNRAKLVGSFLILVQNWIAKGMPRSKARVGSFEEWAAIIGGILESAAIEGFLVNRKALNERADTEMKEWRAFIAVWWEQYQSQEVTVSMLKELAIAHDLLGEVLGDQSERSQRIRMGKALQKMQDRVIQEWKVDGGTPDKHRKQNTWQVIKVVS